MGKITSLLAVFCILLAHCFVERTNAAEDDTLHIQTKTIPSSALATTMHYQVFLPASYDQATTPYPVLYVLDGQWHFINAIAIQQSLRLPDAMPEMIVVGVTSQEPIRRDWFGEQASEFSAFIEKELVPVIDNTYRTNSNNILFGWEMGAFYASDQMAQADSPFNGYILSNGGEIDPSRLIQRKKQGEIPDTYIFIANSDKDIYTVDYSDQLADHLTAYPIESWQWTYQKFNQETHESLPYIALYEGLKFYYHNFGDPVFSSIDNFIEMGGIPFLTQYFKSRGIRFNQPTEISEGTKNTLIWLAWKRDNFEYFKMFMSAFSDVLTTPRYDSAYWQNRFGRFYLKHGELDTAKDYFQKAIVNYPNTLSLHEGLAQVFKAQGDTAGAQAQYLKAIALAEQSQDPSVSQLKADLAKLRAN